MPVPELPATIPTTIGNAVSQTIPNAIKQVSDIKTSQLVSVAWNTIPAILAGLILVTVCVSLRRLLLKRWDSLPPKAGLRYWIYHALMAVKPWFIWSIGIYTALMTTPYTHGYHAAIHLIFMMLFFLQLGLLGVSTLTHGAHHYLELRHKSDSSRATMVSMLVMVGQMLIWVFIILAGLNTAGINVTAMVAGLGIGGVAVAFAFKSILEDLFGSLSIVFDRPFVLGDFIISGDFMGTVEHIGLKTTRLRSLSGEQIVISNHDLLASRIRNYGRMKERRVLFTIGVEYGTSASQLEKIPTYIKDIISSHEQARVDRSHFASYGASSLDFETVYYVTVPDYNTMMDIQQSINLQIYRKFESEGLAFAFPTQTVHAFMHQAPEEEGRTEPGKKPARKKQ